MCIPRFTAGRCRLFECVQGIVQRPHVRAAEFFARIATAHVRKQGGRSITERADALTFVISGKVHYKLIAKSPRRFRQAMPSEQSDNALPLWLVAFADIWATFDHHFPFPARILYLAAGERFVWTQAAL